MLRTDMMWQGRWCSRLWNTDLLELPARWWCRSQEQEDRSRSKLLFYWGRRSAQPRGLTGGGGGGGRLIHLKAKTSKTEKFHKNNFVHRHHEKHRIQAGLDWGLSFERCRTEGHASLTHILQGPRGRGTPRNKLPAPQIAHTHIFSPPVGLLPGNHTDPK